LTQTEGHESL